jgi:hypothetical protein
MKKRLQNCVLGATSVLVGFLVAEGVTRYLDNLPVFATSFVQAQWIQTATPTQRDEVPLAQGVLPAWFFDDPPALPNRRKPTTEWFTIYEEMQQAMRLAMASGPVRFQPGDVFRVWNKAWANDPCENTVLRTSPARSLYFYDPPDGLPRPIYRYYPNATTPGGLVTNEIGWRGPPLKSLKSNTVRIVFVGASTTAETHSVPWSYPEFVNHWLGLWAASKRIGVDFQALNAGREGMSSPDIAAIVRNEVVPMQPDLVVYYEGANQFSLASIATNMPHVAPPSSTLVETPTPSWLQELVRYSALARRLQAALGLLEDNLNGREPIKPDYRLEWPKGLNERDPDLNFSTLPVQLNRIQADLDQMRADLATVGAELAVSSFVWFVKDGMVLDPVRDRYILQHLNRTMWPFRYRDLERLATFQSRVFAKYAALHNLAFIDVARDMPRDPDLFSDAIHNTAVGVRVRAWVVFQKLVPVIEGRLASGQWPKKEERREQRPMFEAQRMPMPKCEGSATIRATTESSPN